MSNNAPITLHGTASAPVVAGAYLTGAFCAAFNLFRLAAIPQGIVGRVCDGSVACGVGLATSEPEADCNSIL